MGQHGKHRTLVSLLAALALFWAGAASAQCRLALALALDVSSSVDMEEYRQQRDGLAAALEDADVRAALFAPGPPVAIAIYEWSGRYKDHLIADWALIQSDAELTRLTTTLRAADRSSTRFPTAMGYALGYGAKLIERGPRCDRAVIDVSGDGINNDGFAPSDAYRHFPFDHVTVNGLAVLGADPQVLDYYQDELRFGPGAFVETADGYDGFRRAMTRKLFREISHMMIGALPKSEAPG